MTAPIFSSLRLNKLTYSVRVGWEQPERNHAQEVRFDFEVRFARLPVACMSDQLEDGQCFSELSRVIERIACGGEFRLIEHLALQVFQGLKEKIGPDEKLWLRVTKEKPPISALHEGAAFCIGDWEQSG